MSTQVQFDNHRVGRYATRHVGLSLFLSIFILLFCVAKDAAAAATPVITSATTASGTVGKTFSYQMAATNTPTSYGAAGLPAGLTLSSTTGLISGTPTASGTYAVTLRATNSSGPGNATLSLTIIPTSYLAQATANHPSSTASTFSVSFPHNTVAGDIILVGFDFIASATLSSISDSQGNTFTEVGSQLTSPGGGASRDYYAKNIKGGADTVTVNLSANSAYIEVYLTEYYGMNQTTPIDAQAGAAGSAGAVSSGNATTTTAGDVIYGYCAADYACTAGSGFTARSTMNGNLIEDETAGNPGAYAATGSANRGWTMQMVALKPALPVITSATTASGAVASTFSYQITATGVPTSYGAAGLPAGLSLNTTTGLISGTPSAAGTYSVTLSATNSSGTGNAPLTLTVLPTSYVAQATANHASASASTFSVSFPHNTVAGDVIMVGFDFVSSVSLQSISDSQGNSFTEVGNQLTSPGGGASRVYYAKNIKGGADTVTVNLSANSAYIEVYLTEYSGMNQTSPIDAQPGAAGSAGAVSSGNATTNFVGDVIYGYCAADYACTVGPGFTARSTMNGNLIEDETAGNPGAYAATGSANSGWTMQMVALKPVSVVVGAPVTTNPVPILSATSLTFASQVVGATTTAQTVTLTNSGTAALSISSIALSGANAGDFAQTNNCGSSVAVGANCAVSVAFKPTATGTRTAAVTLTDNCTGGQQAVSLSGTGTAATASLSPTSLTFASQAVGATSAAQTVTLTNSGTAALSISSIALSGTNAGDFAQTNNCGSSVAVGANCAVSVTFKPTASGSRAAAVTLTDNGTGSPHSVNLSGTGGSGSAVANISPSSLTFGSEPVDMTSSSQVITLSNTGSAALTISSIAFTGTNATDFTEADTCIPSVAAGGNCTIAILFTPAASGTRTASLSITDNASGSPQAASLSGTGSHDVILSWTASPTSGIAGYNIYRGTASGGESSTPLNSTPASGTSYTDEGVSAGTTYYYVVTAVASGSGAASAASNETAAAVPSP